ncbi:hypothetical protein M758_12G189000 [Ceratodon purpureus]|nr:hypothetical protein M758_12G189000 [Ceratodon purpureus]
MEACGRVLQSVQLTASGRPSLEAGEVECQLLDAIDLEDDAGAWALKAGILTLTTHRLLWLDEKARRAWAVPLGSIGQVFASKKGLKSMFSAPRMRFQVWTQKDGRVSPQGSGGAAGSVVLTIVFKGRTGPESFVQKFGEVLQAQAWKVNMEAPQIRPTLDESAVAGEAGTSSVPTVTVPRRPAPFKMNPAMAGVSGILRKEQEQQEEVDKNMKEAFQDLNGLMGKAKEMVQLAEKMRARLLQGQTAGADEEGMGTKQEMQDWMLSVGIASPVTKESAGALYHQQLSRQLADFVKDPVQRAGGMLALVDAYCLFNRARGTELISPEDLLTACTVWATIDVPFRLRKFDSGVMVIQSVSQSDDEIFTRLRALVKSGDAAKVGVGATEAARALGMAPALAKEQLLAAESQGFLCRDDGEDGLRFFHNFFIDISVATAFEDS